jgi:hypothetical protein
VPIEPSDFTGAALEVREVASRRWYAFAQLTRRYSKGNPETDIDYDIRQIDAQGLEKYCGVGPV